MLPWCGRHLDVIFVCVTKEIERVIFNVRTLPPQSKRGGQYGLGQYFPVLSSPLGFEGYGTVTIHPSSGQCTFPIIDMSNQYIEHP